MVKVGIVGGTGYTGVELLRLLAQHPQAEVVVITSRSEAGLAVADMYPNLRGHYDGLAFSVPDIKTLGVYIQELASIRDRLFITGKLWPRVFEVRITRK